MDLMYALTSISERSANNDGTLGVTLLAGEAMLRATEGENAGAVGLRGSHTLGFGAMMGAVEGEIALDVVMDGNDEG